MPHLERPDYTPQLTPYQDIRPFRAWIQSVLPQVYDDSLSYYEVLAKMVVMLNAMLQNIDSLRDNDGKILSAFQDLQSYIDAAFDAYDTQWEDWTKQQLDELNAWKDGVNSGLDAFKTTLTNQQNTFETSLTGKFNTFSTNMTNNFASLSDHLQQDLQNWEAEFSNTWNSWTEEQKEQYAKDLVSMKSQLETYIQAYVDDTGLQQYIDHKIDLMVQDGSLQDVIEPLLKPMITPALVDWLEEHHDELGIPPLDDTLTVKNAAADAQATGQFIANTMPILHLAPTTNNLPTFQLTLDSNARPALSWCTNARACSASVGDLKIRFVPPGISVSPGVNEKVCSTLSITDMTNNEAGFAVVYHSTTNTIGVQGLSTTPLKPGDYVAAVCQVAPNYNLLGNDACFDNVDVYLQKAVQAYQTNPDLQPLPFNVLRLTAMSNSPIFMFNVTWTSTRIQVSAVSPSVVGTETDRGIIGLMDNGKRVRISNLSSGSTYYTYDCYLSTTTDYVTFNTQHTYAYIYRESINDLMLIDLMYINQKTDWVLFTINQYGVDGLGNEGFITNNTPMDTPYRQKPITLIPYGVSGLVINFPASGAVGVSIRNTGAAFAFIDGKMVVFRDSSTTTPGFSETYPDCVVTAFTAASTAASNTSYFLVYDSVAGALAIRTGAVNLQKYDYIIAVRRNAIVTTWGSEAAIKHTGDYMEYSQNVCMPQLTNKSMITEGNLTVTYNIAAATMTLAWSRTTATNGRFTFIDPWGYSLARNTNSSITHAYDPLLIVAHFKGSYNFQMYTMTELNALTPAQITQLSVLGIISYGIFTPAMPMGAKTTLTNPASSAS